MSNNVAKDRGGNIFNIDGRLNLASSTLALGSSSKGSLYTNNGELVLKNTIVHTSKGDACGFENSGRIISSSYSIVNDASCKLEGEGNLQSTDPRLAPLSDFAGTKVHLPLPGSPALNKVLAAFCPLEDQRGVERPQGDACDIGAIERTDQDKDVLDAQGRPVSIGMGVLANFLVPTIDQFETTLSEGVAPQKLEVTWTLSNPGGSPLECEVSLDESTRFKTDCNAGKLETVIEKPGKYVVTLRVKYGEKFVQKSDPITVNAPTPVVTTAPAEKPAVKPAVSPVKPSTVLGSQILGFPAGASDENLIRLALDAQGRAVIVHRADNDVVISRWNATAWQGLGTRLPGPVRTEYMTMVEDLIFDAQGFPIVATYEEIDGCGPCNIESFAIRRWNGSAWIKLGSLSKAEQVKLSLDAKGNVYAVTNNYIQEIEGPVKAAVRMWNGKAWIGLGVNQFANGTQARLWFSKDGKPTLAVWQLKVQSNNLKADSTITILQWNGKVWGPVANSKFKLNDGSLSGLEVVIGSNLQPMIFYPMSNQTLASRWTGSRWESAGAIAGAGNVVGLYLDRRNQPLAVIRTKDGFVVRTLVGAEWRTLGNFASNGFSGDRNALSAFGTVGDRMLALGNGSQGAVLQSFPLPTVTAMGSVPVTTKPPAAPANATTSGLQSLGFPAGATSVNLVRLVFDPQGRPVMIFRIGNKLMVSRWSGSSWQTISSGFPAKQLTAVGAIAFDAKGFPVLERFEYDPTLAPNPRYNPAILRWTGSSWIKLGSLAGSSETHLYFDSKGNLYATVSGESQQELGPSGYRLLVRLWNGKSWVAIGDKDLPEYSSGIFWISSDSKPSVAVIDRPVGADVPLDAPFVLSVRQWTGKNWVLVKGSKTAIVFDRYPHFITVDPQQHPVALFQDNDGSTALRRWMGSQWEVLSVVENQDMTVQKVVFDTQGQPVVVSYNKDSWVVRTRVEGAWRTLGNFASSGFSGDKNELSDFVMVANRVFALGIGAEGVVSQSLPLPASAMTVAPAQPTTLEVAPPTVASIKSLQRLGLPAQAKLENTKLFLDRTGTPVAIFKVGAQAFVSRFQNGAWRSFTSALKLDQDDSFSKVNIIFDAKNFPVIASVGYSTETYGEIDVYRWNGKKWSQLDSSLGGDPSQNTLYTPQLSFNRKGNLYMTLDTWVRFPGGEASTDSSVNVLTTKGWRNLGTLLEPLTKNQSCAGEPSLTSGGLGFNEKNMPVIVTILSGCSSTLSRVDTKTWMGKKWRIEKSSQLLDDLFVTFSDQQNHAFVVTQAKNSDANSGVRTAPILAQRWNGSSWAKLGKISDGGFELKEILFSAKNVPVAVLKSENSWSILRLVGQEWKTVGEFTARDLDASKSMGFSIVKNQLFALGSNGTEIVLQSLPLL